MRLPVNKFEFSSRRALISDKASQSWSLLTFIHLPLFFLVSLDLRFDCFPINFDVSSILFHPLIVLLLPILLQETLPIGYDCVYMRLVLDRYIHSSIPSVQFDVELDRSVVEPSTQQYLLSFRNSLLVDQHGCLTSRLTSKLLLDVVNILDLVCFIDLSQCNFHCVQLATIDTHGSECSPQGLLIYESTQSDNCLEIKFLNVLV